MNNKFIKGDLLRILVSMAILVAALAGLMIWDSKAGIFDKIIEKWF